jgi:hypothetical protein
MGIAVCAANSDREAFMSIIDTNRNTKAIVKKLAHAGVTTICRYYSAPSAKSKILSKDEAAAISSAGMSIVTVFEHGDSPTLDKATGASHASLARDQAAAIGQSKGSAIYFALDSELGPSALPGVKAYFAGVKSVVNGDYQIGVYGDGVVCQALLDDQTCKFAWLSASRGFPGSKAFYASKRWSLAQDPHVNQKLAGIGVDYNEANGAIGDFRIGPPIAAGRGKSPTPAPSAPAHEASGNFYTDVIQRDPRFHSVDQIDDPNLLEPSTRALVQAILADAKQLGIEMMIVETYRSTERQQALFDQHATQLKKVGVHHYGLACDIAKRIGGKPSWKGDFSFLGHIARHHGLVWGGDWGQPSIRHSFQDNDHVQRCTIGRQPSLFAGKWYPDANYDPYKDGAH